MKRFILLSLAVAALAPTTPIAWAQPAPQEPAEPAPEGAEPEAPPAEPAPETPAATRETVCDDRRDEDGDGLVDCADADCFEADQCDAGGQEERNDERCSDWIDNDGDSAIDCDDSDCQGPGITVCRGSHTGHGGGGAHPGVEGEDDLPELTGDMTVEDLIGHFGDADGERNDLVCSDGVDNDGDGRTDCADFGCRFDPQVTVCQGSPGVRFGVVAGVGAAYDLEAPAHSAMDVRFTRLQLRAFGQIPLIEHSFFLLSTRWEKSPRLTFALFQVPLGDAGHFIGVNSGNGSLSTGLVVSASKQPLLDPPYYLYSAFEQGSGAAVETGGPFGDSGRLKWRLFVSGGAGGFTGNVGGRFLPDGDENFAWAAGGQLQINFLGYFDRFDSAFIYAPEPLTFGMLLGGMYDVRPRERYPAFNGYVLFKYDRLLLRAESYTKYVIDYGGAFQWSWNAQTSVLVVPRTLMLAADVGQFYSQDFEPNDAFGGSLRRPLDHFEWRAAMHWYWYRNIGVLSLLYREAHIEDNPDRSDDETLERELRLEGQFRF